NLQYQEAMQLPESGARIVQIVLTPRDARMAEFRLASTTGDDADGWRTHLIGAVRARPGSSADPASSLAIGDVKRRCTEFIPADRFYAAVRAIGLEYGVSFRGIQSVHRGSGEVLTKVKLPDNLPADDDSGLHPALLDACLHVFPALVDECCDFGQVPDRTRDTYLPIGLEALRGAGIGGREVWAHVKRRTGDVDPAIATIDIGIYREDGSIAAAMDGLSLKRLPPEALRPARQQQTDWLYQLRWLECPPSPSKARSSAGGWLILADRAGVGSALADLLIQHGGSCRLIRLDDLNDQHGAPTWATPDDLVEPFTAVMSELTGDSEQPLRGVVDLWPLDLFSSGVDVRTLRIAQQIAVGASASLFKAMESVREQRAAVAPRLWFVSRNAVAALYNDLSTEATSAALWGLGRTAALEYPQLWGGLIDLEQSHQSSVAHDAAILHREIVHGDGEDQIAVRAGRRFGARLVRADLPEPVQT